MKYDEYTAVLQYLAIRDQCQHLSKNGYSTNFCLKIMPKMEELLHNNLTLGTELFDFWVEQTKDE